MQVYPTMKVTVLLLVTCELCWTIRVPVAWDDTESNEKQDYKSDELVFSVDTFKPQEASETLKTLNDDSEELKPQNSRELSRAQNKKPIPIEYFEYTAKKPQFAVDVAAYHGVQSPENHYKAYPIRPYTGETKPELGKHHILDNQNTFHKPFQQYTKINEDVGHANPASSSYEVFHPYEAEIPALQEIYKDPVLTKIRNDLENSRVRLQQYEKDAEKTHVTKDEYLESPQRTDTKLFPTKKYRPAPFEIHRPQRRPVYYRPVPVYKSRDQYLNQKLRHPWKHNTAKVRPLHYQPIQSYIHQLRQNHALKFDDERNEYPEVQVFENYADPKDGYDIYENGKDKFVHLRNNVDESINKAAKENRPLTYEKLEVQDNDSASDESDDDGEDDQDEFVPIKNYAQVRRTETFKYMPKGAALQDAETYDEIKNSPRLREAVKSTKAQTVYSEEGYEDAAYDHAGEQKHASENEGHGGFLKENELSGGKYKAPSVSTNFEDGEGSVSKDKIIHAEKWDDTDKDTKEESDEENYAEDEHEHLLEADNHQSEPQNEANHRNKRENSYKNETLFIPYIQSNDTEDTPHKSEKPEINFEVPQVDLNSTFFKEEDFLKIAKLRAVPKRDAIRQKYPYYFKKLKAISNNSPLRYAENLRLIPKKSKGGTEFYDSRSKFECPEVEDVPNPVPEKLKGDGHPDENDDSSAKKTLTNGDDNFDTTKKQPRLKGLGDKIDCFKAKYFGKNPLDSPFFREEIISNPEPIFLPNIAAYKRNISSFLKRNIEIGAEPNAHNVVEKFQNINISNLFDLIETKRSDQNVLQNFTAKPSKTLVISLSEPQNYNNSNSTQLADQSNVYSDIIMNIKANNVPKTYINNLAASSVLSQNEPSNNITYLHFQNKEDITKSPILRKKRAAPFVYEPYKIIKDGFFQDDQKKTTIISNVSPLIRHLHSSKVIDTVVTLSPNGGQHVKRNANTHAYKNIGPKDREIKYGASKNGRSYENSEIVDVNLDKRRGEPRYEIKHVNHKSKYTPITNAKSMTKEEYETNINGDKEYATKARGESGTVKLKIQNKPTETPYFDVSQFIPRKTEVQKITASHSSQPPDSTMSSILSPYVSLSFDKDKGQDKYTESDEDYEEYDEEENKNDDKIGMTSTTTTSTTSKPALRRRTRPQTTTEEPFDFIEEPRLKLVTRFRDYSPKGNLEKNDNLGQREILITHTTKQPIRKNELRDKNVSPKFRKKKKQVTKSTLVTDTKKYGDAVEGDDEVMKDEVDSLIGIRQNMDDYVPLYEKEKKNKEILSKENKANKDNSSKDSDVDEYEDRDENEDDGEEDEDDNEYGDEDDDEDEDVDSDEDEVNDEDNSSIDEEDMTTEKEVIVTTPEPTERTLVITTDAPFPTAASRSAKLREKPFITRKKIEIHNELPVNKSSPHITEYKQDIKEIEIIKESRNPLKRKPGNKVEILDLYKDVNLARDINKLGVEIFRENLDLRQGPKHGGNYRNVAAISTNSKKDAETSQSEHNKHIDDNSRTSTDTQNIMNRDKNSELIELHGIHDTSMHKGNLNHGVRSRNAHSKSQKLIELVDEHDEESSSSSQEEKPYSSSRRERPMHGGNYRSAKLTQEKSPTTTETNTKRRNNARGNAALVLSSFVQAVPILTTTSAYILDPSKRKYYYVDV